MLESRVDKTLNKYGANIVANLQRELRSNNNIATGKAIDSLRHEIDHDSGQIALNIIGVRYLEKIDKGRKLNRKPPSSKTIEKWIKAKSGFKLRDYRGRWYYREEHDSCQCVPAGWRSLFFCRRFF